MIRPKHRWFLLLVAVIAGILVIFVYISQQDHVWDEPRQPTPKGIPSHSTGGGEIHIPANKPLSICNFSVEGISTGYLYSEVVQKLGNPLHLKKWVVSDDDLNPGPHMSLIYPGLRLNLHEVPKEMMENPPKDYSVYEIIVTEPQWKINANIGVGMDWAKVRSALNSTKSPGDPSGGQTLGNCSDTKDCSNCYWIEFKEGRAIKIVIMEDWS